MSPPDAVATPRERATIPSTVQRTLLICEYMNKLDFSPKDFMVTFLSSNHEDIAHRRRMAKAGLGTKGTRSIVKNLGKMTRASEEGQTAWENMILDEATAIVNAQDVQSGYFPSGAFASSNRITPNFFGESAEGLRNDQIQCGMRFLHTLIHRKLASGMKKTDLQIYDAKDADEPCSGSDTTAPDTRDVHIEGAEDEAAVLSLENLVFVKTTPANRAAHKLDTVPTMLCAMLAACCNRRHNAIPLANGLMTLAAGVSCRVNEWLHAYGLTTSQATVLRAMDQLRELQEARMIDLFKINHKIMPILCFDNIDIHLKIHNPSLEKSSRLFHGTWGFFNVIRDSQQSKCSEHDASLPFFLESMATADRTPVQIAHFTPSPDEMDHWVAVIKCQLAKALKEYSAHIPGAPEAHMLPATLETRPPPVDPITMHKPNIHFLRMMDAPDSSADGVSRVLDAIMAQIGVEKEAYAKKLLVAGGDVGSNQLVESLRVKRFPPINSLEGIEWVLSVFGGAHTNWNFAKAIWSHHWGNSDQSEDSGVWRSSFALGGDYKKPVAAQDFNSIMRSIQLVHQANLVHILTSVIAGHKELDLTKHADCNTLLDHVWTEYFANTAIEEAKERTHHTHFNFLMRLRDFATVVEAHESTRAGDIGRLIAMWRRWSVMAQGLPGLSHYARHIPRMVMLLEHDLPKSLAHVIKHSLLIPCNERNGHWLAIDEFLEVYIFWLKHMYNNTGHGTDIERLIYRFSNNIPLLRRLIQLLKAHSGHKLVFQPNLNRISESAMQAFLQYAQDHLSNTTSSQNPKQVANVWYEGMRQLIKVINADQAAGRTSRFRWGASNVLSSWDNPETQREE